MLIDKSLEFNWFKKRWCLIWYRDIGKYSIVNDIHLEKICTMDAVHTNK
jgi:hypothetical protein